jgi:hypothetical protein
MAVMSRRSGRECCAILVVLAAALTAMQANAQRAAPAPGEVGTLALSDVLAIAKPYPNLVNEIRLAALAAGQDRKAITCTAERFSVAWTGLNGRRSAPYVCPVGARTVTIRATPQFFDRNGHKIALTDPRLLTSAVRLIETRLVWQWK